ncbi:hypothetical protein [Streptomyces stelliscabiei]|uniref:hypothetical protein n=1 Tax=Streptomyces stelliscabiei TaxID=146820 RepID=UPI0029B6BFB8|nr:hypothetical protein [Streptomyces stelliscabiei]MDX2557762.1 hypothetical protein [Streptomyces stelliscabiei]MDX2617520.1 hypothetical protein [Streptomyces stelliscabiei]MDX2641797.1 hypothetical protein [Streptomyces stelliscabiei]MDX2667170.1 hypothetical protein [Streptomyces stelliscabiei]MDX2717748.1 hypothetical protein [Streptomyces stelliscabiei]
MGVTPSDLRCGARVGFGRLGRRFVFAGPSSGAVRSRLPGSSLAHLSPRAELRLSGRLSPSTVAVIAPMKLGIPPREEEVLTPAEARARHGYAKPAEAHLAFRARQAARVFDAVEAPSDQGLTESQEILGPLS